MLHGIIYAKQAEHLNDDPGNDLADEVYSYFGSGTQLQELYVTPALLSVHDWDTIANAARWSREHASILRDAHWIGGDPGKLDVYGWAAWSPDGWVITLRNPSSREQRFALDLKAALELPANAPGSYLVKEAFTGAAGMTISTSQTQWIVLKPFEVRVFERAK